MLKHKIGLVALVMGLLVGCGEMEENSRAVATMEAAGYSHVAVTGKHGMAASWNGCSESDAVAFDVTATNPAGRRVTATVCCGLWGKGCTIRH